MRVLCKSYSLLSVSLMSKKFFGEIITIDIGTFDIQDCNVSTDHTSILVECTFAINSTAPGIVVIQDDQSQYTINKTLQRLQQDSDKGSVNITGLPAGEYSVRVYDNMEDNIFAFLELLEIISDPSKSLPPNHTVYYSGELVYIKVCK